MNPNQQTLRPGFITIDDAIRLIKEDKRDDAKVDLQFLVNNLPYLKAKHIYNIRKLKTVDGKVVRDGTLYVTIHSEYDRQILLKAIQEAYTERTKIQFNADEPEVSYVSTIVDQEASRMMGTPTIVSSDAVLQRNEVIKEGASQVIQGQ